MNSHSQIELFRIIDRQINPISERFMKKEFLGAGGMCKTYSATTSNGRNVVLKKLYSNDTALTIDNLDQALEEYLQYQGVQNVANQAYFDYGIFADSNQNLWIIQEKLNGQPLSEIHEPIPLKDVFLIAKDIALYVKDLMSAGYVTLDLKPDNIFVEYHGGVLSTTVKFYDIDSVQQNFAKLTTSDLWIPIEAYNRYTNCLHSDLIGPWTTTYTISLIVLWLLTDFQYRDECISLVKDGYSDYYTAPFTCFFNSILPLHDSLGEKLSAFFCTALSSCTTLEELHTHRFSTIDMFIQSLDEIISIIDKEAVKTNSLIQISVPVYVDPTDFPCNINDSAAKNASTRGVPSSTFSPDALLTMPTHSHSEKSEPDYSAQYRREIISQDYLDWENKTLKSIYYDIPFTNVFGREYPVYTIAGSENVSYPFDALTPKQGLSHSTVCLDYSQTYLYKEFEKVISPHVHFPDLYGYTNQGFTFDTDGNIQSIKATPRTYKESVYTCHILHYELWKAYHRLGGERLATLDDLPLRKAIHAEKPNLEVLLTGCNRSALNDVSIAVLIYNDIDKEYGIVTAKRTENVATHPNYTCFVPSGGFELYELEDNQNDYIINKNYNVIGALYREFLEELFGDTTYGEASGDDDLNRLYNNPKVREIDAGVRNGTIQFVFLGVGFDLTTLRQTLDFALRIDSKSFFSDNALKKNTEHKVITLSSLQDLEDIVKSTNAAIMPETAGTYALLKNAKIFTDIIDNSFELIRPVSIEAMPDSNIDIQQIDDAKAYIASRYHDYAKCKPEYRQPEKAEAIKQIMEYFGIEELE